MNNRLLVIALRLLLASFLLNPAVATAGDIREEAVQVGSDRFLKYTLPTEGGPPVEYFISRTPAPSRLILYIQGSGCAPAFFEMQPGNHASTIFSLTTVAHRRNHAVMVVNKPHVPSRPPPNAGTAVNCPEAFNAWFALESWRDHVNRALEHALARPWVRGDRTLAIGISEGATVAAALAAVNPRLTDVALIGATGPGQFYDMLALAYLSGDDDAEILQVLEEREDRFAQIRAAPDAADRFAWGHPFKRWSSFFASSSLQNLLGSDARVYLLSGMADRSVPVLSTEVLYAELLAAGRDVRFRRLPNAGHGLLPPDANWAEMMPRLETEYADIVEWFDHGR